MSTRPPAPVQVPIYRLCELPVGTKVRWGNGAEETIWQPGSGTNYVEVVAWPPTEPRRVPWHQAFTERLPIVELDGLTIQSAVYLDALLMWNEMGDRTTVPADGMVTVHEPEPEAPAATVEVPVPDGHHVEVVPDGLVSLWVTPQQRDGMARITRGSWPVLHDAARASQEREANRQEWDA